MAKAAKKDPLIGAYVKAVSEMSPAELAARHWHRAPAVLTLSQPFTAGKGKRPESFRVFPSSDPEGNDGGTIFGVAKEGSFYVFGSADDQTLMRGLVVLGTRPMTKQELDDQMWDVMSWEKPPTVLVMSDGSILFPSHDPEGNRPGIWVVESSAGERLL